MAYVFGYKSKALIQVGITWSKAPGPTMTPEKLYSDDNILREHFLASVELSLRYVADTRNPDIF